MRDGWQGPVMGYFIIAWLAVPVLLIVVIFALLWPKIKDPNALGLIIGLYIPFAIFLLVARRGIGDLARSHRRPIALGLSDARQHLERALDASGLPHSERGAGSDAKAVVWDVRGGLNVSLFEQSEQSDRCYVFVGPVKDTTRREVAGLKRAIDAVLPPHGPPGAGRRGDRR